MTIMKTLPMIAKPVEDLHDMMEKQGFSRLQREGGLEYSIQLHDASSASFYRLVIPLKKQQHNEHDAVYFGQAYLLNGGKKQEELPDSVIEAARSKLAETADYLTSHQKQEEWDDSHTMNGRMASNMQEMVSLGKEMDSMNTNQELMEKGQLPDPIPYNINPIRRRR